MTSRCRLFLLFAIILVTAALPAAPQQVIATVTAGSAPDAAAVNPAANKIYVANYSSGTVTVIDGVTFSTQPVTVGNGPIAVAVNSVTNKIYVVNRCGNDPNCGSAGTMTVIDGVTLSTQTLTVGFYPEAVAVNLVTNKIYLANGCGDSSCTSGSVTVIDGATLSTQTVNNTVLGATAAVVDSVTNMIYVTAFFDNSVTVIDGGTLSTQTVNNVGVETAGLAVNPITNKIYVANHCGNDPNCNSNGTVTVIDGATLSTQSVPVGFFSNQVAVNPVTNKIYVTDACGNDPNCKSTAAVTVIDGATLSTQTVSAGYNTYSVVVDPVTNKTYVANRCGDDPTCNSPGTVTVIDGSTLSTAPVTVGAVPWALAVNSVTNRIYVPNYGGGTVSVIAGASATALQFVSVPPCRLVDTRGANGEFGGPPLQGQQTRSFPVPGNQDCNIPSNAAAYSLNVTVVPRGTLGYLTVWPTGEDQPLVSTLNSTDGRVKANAAIVPAGYQGAVTFFVTDTTDLILDIDGYFVPPNSSTLAFYALPPCRIADTRNSNYPQGLGPPYLSAGVNRDFPVLNATSCNIPSSAQAYSLNFTAVPHGSLGYLTVCPTPSGSQDCPLVSTLNSYGGQVVANAAIVPAGVMGEIRTFAFNDTDLIIDINGYFGAPGPDGLSLYPVAPCRVIDTRPPNGSGPFQFALNPPVDVRNSACSPPSQSEAYVFNATVVPQGPLGYLTLWPDGGNQPVVSTLNADDGVISSNMAIVPANLTNGKVDAYAFPGNQNDQTNVTNLILDISSYFAP